MNARSFSSFILTCSVSLAYGNEVLDRLEFPQYDAETLKMIKPTQRLLDNYLEIALHKFLNIAVSRMLEPLHYNENEMHVTFQDLKMALENISISAKSELLQQILRVELTASNVNIDGTYLIKLDSTKKTSNFRFTSKNVVCSGTAGLLLNSNEIACEWLLIDCLQEDFTPFKISSINTPKDGNPYSRKINSVSTIETGLLRIIETKLSSVTLMKLKEALNQLHPSLQKLLRNMANTKSAQLETSDSNTFLDAAISVASYFIKIQYNDTIHLPDINEAIPCSLLSLFNCETGFIAENGLAKDVSALQREGNARITRRNVTVDFAGTLRFQKLNVFYEKYRTTVLGIGPTGSLKLTSEPVIFGIQLRVNFGTRRIHLTGFKLKKLGRTEVEVSGLGVLGKVLKEFTTSMIGIFNSFVSRIVEGRVANYIREALKKNTIDDLLNGNINTK